MESKKFSIAELEKMLNDGTLNLNLVAIAKQLQELEPDYHPEIGYMISGYSWVYENRKSGEYRSIGDHDAMFADMLDNQKYDITRRLIELLRG